MSKEDGRIMLSRCPYCGEQVLETSNFCASCGQQLRELPPENAAVAAPEEERWKPMPVWKVTISRVDKD